MSASSGIKAGAAYVELFLKDKLSRGLKRASARLKSWGGSMQGMGLRVAAIGGANGPVLAQARTDRGGGCVQGDRHV